MEKVFASPSRYVQGKDILKTGTKYIKELGEKPILLSGKTTWEVVGKAFSEQLSKEGFKVTRASFKGESSTQEIDRIAALGQAEGCDVVLALGGGKAIDTGKAVADQLNLPVAVLPTIASTDAPTSALSVIYTEAGAFEKYLFYKKNPELVLVDTAVIAKAPVRLLASGIADAMATWVEVRAVAQANGATMAGGHPTVAAMAIAEKCENTLFQQGLQAIEANRRNVVTPALEAIVEANTLLSGIGFESGGLAAAHAIHNGFTALHGDIHSMTHGEKVAYGTLTQLFLEGRPKDVLEKYIRFYQALGLPTTLAEIKLADASYEDLCKVGEQATIEGETIHQMPFAVTAGDVTDAIIAVDAYVKAMN